MCVASAPFTWRIKRTTFSKYFQMFYSSNGQFWLCTEFVNGKLASSWFLKDGAHSEKKFWKLNFTFFVLSREIDNWDPPQLLLPGNKQWHWTAFGILWFWKFGCLIFFTLKKWQQFFTLHHFLYKQVSCSAAWNII